MKHDLLTLVLALLLVSGAACAQQENPGAGAGAQGGGLPAQGTGRAVALPRGFRGVELGMEVKAVEDRLAEDPLYDFRGEPDVSLLPQPQQTLIESAGSSFIRRAFFQFDQGRLYILILALDPEKLDYYTVYRTLGDKYGPPDSLDPSEAVWESSAVRLSLERPLSVKYIDVAAFRRLQDQGQARRDAREIAKEQFLGQF